ncbi:hypothetical protein IJF81_02805 [bacterium]|nr:hypothetical protein [bacterium]
MKNKLFLSINTLFLTTAAAMAAPITLKNALSKFGVVMGLVAASIIVISVVLLIYKKVRRPQVQEPEVIQDTTLKTPETIEDAVGFYTIKNKL